MQDGHAHVKPAKPPSVGAAHCASEGHCGLPVPRLLDASPLKMRFLLCALRGKTRAEGCFPLRFEVRGRVDETERYREVISGDRSCTARGFRARTGEIVRKGTEEVGARELMGAEGREERWRDALGSET